MTAAEELARRIAEATEFERLIHPGYGPAYVTIHDLVEACEKVLDDLPDLSHELLAG